MDSLEGVPREAFILDTVWTDSSDGWMRPVHRSDDPEEWAAAVDTDDAIVTQVDDGEAVEKGIWPTSSSSAPWIMRRMLDALGLEPGMRVLEIGTGTGYNAAVLAEAGASVVSVEIDPGLADHARRALAATGYADRVTVLTGDGEAGAPAHAPYDRVIATAAAHTIPYAWVEQTHDGGRIVLPYTGPHNGNALLSLTVHDGVATGTAVGDAAFMPLRGQRLSQADLRAITDAPDLAVRVTAGGTRVTPAAEVSP